jgi:hypothetical protein
LVEDLDLIRGERQGPVPPRGEKAKYFGGVKLIEATLTGPSHKLTGTESKPRRQLKTARGVANGVRLHGCFESGFR